MKAIQDNLEQIYLILGTEKYLQDEVRQAFLKKTQVVDEADLNFAAFDLREDRLAEVMNEVESMPFFGDHRLVFVENPDFLTGAKNQKEQENLAEFIAYLQQPVESTVLVIFAPYEKLDERKKVTKTLKKTATLIETKPPTEGELKKLLLELFATEQISISSDNLELILRLTDLSLSKIMGEFQKLVTNVGAHGEITQEIIQDLIPKTLEHNIFDMTNFVLQGKAEAALRLYDDLLLQGEETIKINSILISQVRLYLQTKILVGIGYQQGNIASTLSIHPYRVKLAMQEVRRFQLETLETIFDQLVENDYRFKTGQGDKEILFQLFVLNTVGKVS
ncbi:DNA polymerase III subunit delta [Enterococcus sp. HY326]|uniref:DNA polymerase III subunit delta n=1 Tax=Enterococcus sp. HY326 TaxID=2971265 RepID=UPI003A103349